MPQSYHDQRTFQTQRPWQHTVEMQTSLSVKFERIKDCLICTQPNYQTAWTYTSLKSQRCRQWKRAVAVGLNMINFQLQLRERRSQRCSCGWRKPQLKFVTSFCNILLAFKNRSLHQNSSKAGSAIETCVFTGLERFASWPIRIMQYTEGASIQLYIRQLPAEVAAAEYSILLRQANSKTPRARL